VKSSDFRRVPKQSRSQKRFDSILDTAANLFLEKGFSSATTNEIARRADMSIGSLYQYFRDKNAVVDALGERYLEELREVMGGVATVDVGNLPSVAESVDRLIDPILEFHASHPAFRALWLEMEVSPELQRLLQGMDDEVVKHVEALIEARIRNIRRERAHMTLVVMQLALKSLIGVLSRSDDAKFDAQATAETKRMLTAYIEEVIREHEG
jgi:AcrR family transcriptional regulator